MERRPRPRIVIVGAGFGGMAAAKGLRRAAADITLVDRTNHHLFQPLLYQVATAALSPADIAAASRALLRGQRNITVLMGTVDTVDTAGKRVGLSDGAWLAYDALVLAAGVKYNFFGHDEWAEHAAVLKTLDDALAIRARLLAAFELAERAAADPARQRRLLTFVVVGGGPTGVEMAGTTAELARHTLAKDFRKIDPRSARVILCEAGGRVLAGFSEPLSAYAAKALEELGVELRLGEAVEAIDAGGLTVGGERIETGTVIWCAGTRAEPAAAWIGARPAPSGGVPVMPDCSVPGFPEIFAIGDVASCDDGAGRPLPGLAPVAKQQGAYVARVLAARLTGRPPPPPFRYRDFGTMAVIGRSRAVAQFGSFAMKGFPAWLAWSLVHLMLLVDFRSRVLVYVNWTWAFFTHGRSARLLTGRAAAMQRDGPRTDPDMAPGRTEERPEMQSEAPASQPETG